MVEVNRELFCNLNHKIYCLDLGLANIFFMGLNNKLLGFVRHTVCVTTAQLCHCNAETATLTT